MNSRLLMMLVLAAGMTAGLVLIRSQWKVAKPDATPVSSTPSNNSTPAPPTEPASAEASRRSPTPLIAAAQPALEVTIPGTNKLQRLAYVREQFQKLAAANAKLALAAAKQLTNTVERETALLTLVTQWTQGELSSPAERAWAISRYGLEAGLGMELAKNPDLAVLWANELTSGPGRSALLQQTAVSLVSSDPTAAFALGDELTPAERAQFQNAVLAGWAGKDTEAALWWANQLPEGAERDGAVQAIRSVAPVGIGTEIRLPAQGSYPVINGLLAGTPAELSGQLHRGDQIVAVAQADNTFVDTRTLSLQQVVQMIRGAPGTTLQMQVLSADAPPGSAPQTVSILRDQIKFKR